MRLADFIKQNRAEIDLHINSNLTFVPATASCHCPKSGTNHHHEPERLNNEDRRQWILGDETLYLMARRAGVNI